MSKDPSFLLYSSDFLIGCSDLNMEERGQYITLLCLQHQKGHLNRRTIDVAIGTTRNRETGEIISLVSDYVLEKFSIDENGCYYNKRLEEETIKRRNFVESRKANLSKPKNKQHMSSHMEQHMENHKEVHMENENVNVNENENINDNVNDNTNEIVDKVIEYFNQKCKTRYRKNTRDIRKLIIARINEGYTFEDFKTVIDKKYREWKGTEFEKYLRPSTLFGTKFQQYLNQIEKKQSTYGDAEDCFEMAWQKTLEEYEEEE